MMSLYKRNNAAARCWHVIYTRSKWEKKVDKLLTDQGITSFCPLVKTQKSWADRKKMVEIPLFNSYVFVKATLADQHKIQQTPGVIGFVNHCRKPVAIDDLEINRVRNIVNTYSDVKAVNIGQIIVGDKVKVNDGPLIDCYGEVLQVEGRSVLLVMDRLGCALTGIIKIHQSKLQLDSVV